MTIVTFVKQHKACMIIIFIFQTLATASYTLEVSFRRLDRMVYNADMHQGMNDTMNKASVNLEHSSDMIHYMSVLDLHTYPSIVG